MIKSIQQYIKKLNFGYKSDLRSKNVKYFNCFAKFVDCNTLSLTDDKGNQQTVKAKTILIATGGRPNYLDVEGSKECCITSDDIFSIKSSPGKTLVVGASYIALECGGFLTSLGYDTTIMVRSILLRGFDQDMALRIGEYMEKRGTRFIHKAIPTKFLKKDNGKIVVEYDPNSEKGKRNTSTSLSQRINRKIHEKGIANHLNDDAKNYRINRT